MSKPGADPEPVIAQVRAEAVRPVRGVVLRPGQPADRLIYPGDDAATSVHLGCLVEGERIVAVVSLYDEPMPGSDEPAWRIRGMATCEAFRSRGFGGLLLRACVDHVLKTRPGVVWCNARTTAAGFYRLNGFWQCGAEFEIADIGPHVVMVRPA